MTNVERNDSERGLMAANTQAVISCCPPEACWHSKMGWGLRSAVSQVPVPCALLQEEATDRVCTAVIGFPPWYHLFSYQIFPFHKGVPDLKELLTFLLCFTNLKLFFSACGVAEKDTHCTVRPEKKHQWLLLERRARNCNACLTPSPEFIWL